MQLDLTLFSDGEFTWNDDLTEAMSAAEKVQYLAGEASQMMALTEYEIAYGILRELVALEPQRSSNNWKMLHACCEEMGDLQRSQAAAANARLLEARDR